jgi:hypothetical protein
MTDAPGQTDALLTRSPPTKTGFCDWLHFEWTRG